MSNENAAGVGEGFEGLNFTDVLRESFPGAIVIIDPERKVAGFNPAAESFLGVQTNQALEHSLEVLPVSLREVIQLTFDESKAQAREIILSRADSGKLGVHVTTSMVALAKGGSFGVVVVLHDL